MVLFGPHCIHTSCIFIFFAEYDVQILRAAAPAADPGILRLLEGAVSLFSAMTSWDARDVFVH